MRRRGNFVAQNLFLLLTCLILLLFLKENSSGKYKDSVDDGQKVVKDKTTPAKKLTEKK